MDDKVGMNDESLTAGQLVDQRLLLPLHFGQGLVLNGVPLEFCLLFVEQVVQLHHLSFAVFGLAFPFVALPEGSQLFLLDLDGEVVEALGQGGHGFVHSDDLCDELHGETFEVGGFTELFGVQPADVVFFVESYGQLLRH
jgi:hypothetical protein